MMKRYYILSAFFIFRFCQILGQEMLCDGSEDYIRHASFLKSQGEEIEWDDTSFTCLFWRQICVSKSDKQAGFFAVRCSEIHAPWYIYARRSSGRIFYLNHFSQKQFVEFLRVHSKLLSDIEIGCVCLQDMVDILCALQTSRSGF